VADAIPPQSAPQPSIGERFGGRFTLTKAEIAHFATLSGDLNPLHHNENFAQQTRFGGVIVSGPHVISLMMGLTATHFSTYGAMLGLEFTFHFRKAVNAEEIIDMEWVVNSVVPNARLRGTIVSMDGKAINEQGDVVLTGTGKVLVTVKL
jgi:acyl dehydratase